jgi:hypothetical protein
MYVMVYLIAYSIIQTLFRHIIGWTVTNKIKAVGIGDSNPIWLISPVFTSIYSNWVKFGKLIKGSTVRTKLKAHNG